MANFVTADDKRIYDLLLEQNPLLSMFLPIDRSGNNSARKISLQQIVNLLSANGSKQDVNAGTTNPDNTSGNVGDFYYKIPADGSSLTLFKKVSFNSWATVFNLPIGGAASGQLYRVFLIPSSDITDGSVNITGRTNEQGDTVIPSDANVSVYEGGKIVPATYYENGLIEGLDGSLDVKVVLIGGEPAPQPLGITNTTDRAINYSLNGGPFSDLPIGDFLEVNPSDSIIMQLASPSSSFYILANQNGDLQNTDGLYRIDETPHQWNIPSDTTFLQIISPL